MGNSVGDLWLYWEPIYSMKHLQGAFVWDWVDQGLRKPVPDQPGKTFLAYGGDFGPKDVPSDDNFCCNGLVNADRVPHPSLYQIKKVYQSIQVEPVDLAKGKIRVKNIYDFLPLDFVVARWAVSAEGKELASGEFSVDAIEPGKSQEITLPLELPEPAPGMEYWLNVGFRLKNNASWARRGHEVAWDQFLLPVKAEAQAIDAAGLPAVTADESDAAVTLSAGDVLRDRRQARRHAHVVQSRRCRTPCFTARAKLLASSDRQRPRQ